MKPLNLSLEITSACPTVLLYSLNEGTIFSLQGQATKSWFLPSQAEWPRSAKKRAPTHFPAEIRFTPFTVEKEPSWQPQSQPPQSTPTSPLSSARKNRCSSTASGWIPLPARLSPAITQPPAKS